MLALAYVPAVGCFIYIYNLFLLFLFLPKIQFDLFEYLFSVSTIYTIIIPKKKQNKTNG